MKSMRIFKYLAVIALAITLVLLFQQVADAQCSMCRAVLSSSNNARFIRQFNLGVLVLLIPPVTIFCSIFVVLKRHRGGAEDSGESDSTSSD